MRDEQHRHAALRLLGKKKVGNLPAGFGVQIACRFIRDQHQWRGSKRARNRHPLLFTAGKLARVVLETLSKSDGHEFLPCDGEGIRHVRELQRHCNVFQRRHVGDQMEGLKNDADVAAAKIGQGVFRKGVQRFPCNVNLAGVKAFKPCKNHEQRRLAGARGPHNSHSFALLNLKVDLLENMHRGRSAPKSEIGLLQFDNGFSQKKASYIGFKQ